MSGHPWRKFAMALVTIELKTAARIGSSEGDNLFDGVFVTDANGLPCIPGESLAGVLRHALAAGENPEKSERCRAIFGYQDRDEGEASRLRISFAQAHGQDNRPVAFRGPIPDDPVLRYIAAGTGRDHVRIGMHGAVDGRGKFDELVVPAGARFTFEMSLASGSDTELRDLVSILARPEVTLGAGSRRGFGHFEVVEWRTASFDLTKAGDLKQLGELPSALHQSMASKVWKKHSEKLAAARAEGPWAHATIRLKPIGTWMVGGGLPTGREPERRNEKPWDRLPLSESRIIWNGDRGRVEDPKEAPWLLPGSSVKGALRHRTAFHLRRLQGRWLDDLQPETLAWPDALEGELFGTIRGEEGKPGRVYISDSYVAARTEFQPLEHVSLDRFTQGPIDHLLYNELALGQAEITLDLAVRTDDLNDLSGRALLCALDDLCSGRLALGAARGHGRFRGDVTWQGGRTPVKEEAARR